VQAYQTLVQRFGRLAALEQAARVLHWDMSTSMPSGGGEARTEQLTALSLCGHEILTDPAMPDLFAAAESDADDLAAWDAANLREMRRVWTHGTALDADLVEARTKATKRCELLWREARSKADFVGLLPAFRDVVSLVRREAEVTAEALGCAHYDALLDKYEPGNTAAEIDRLFAPLSEFLPEFLPRVLERQAQAPAPVLPEGPFPQIKQETLCRHLMEVIGFEFDHGRLDVSVHPFCGGVPDDVRITTRYDEADFAKSLMGVLHETGHALYERGLPPDWRWQPVGQARGMAVHESQSLLIEMQICRSREFQAFLAPLARKAFGGAPEAWEVDNLVRCNNRVRQDYIRVDADEVTYPAHIILRYRLEQAMIAGDLDPADLPAAWNDGMEELLGIRPPDDRLGCLQDIHWYDGLWGYFPAYTLGAMMAAQLFDAAKRTLPGVLDSVSKGDFSNLMTWLGRHVHGRGSLLSATDLMVEATREPLNPQYFLDHLTARYLGLA